MRMMIAWGRSSLAIAVSLVLTMSVATQLIAALLRQHPALGEALIVVGGVKLYKPWQVLAWTVEWMPLSPWLGVLLTLLIGVCVLAALALAACVAAFAPRQEAWRWLACDFASWASMSQYGLLRGDGLAVGAVRRHALARHHLLYAPRGHALVLGDPVHTDAALIAAAASWRSALVVVSASGLGQRLGLQSALRFSPGRADAIAINPLLAIRGGAHAWSDALLLAEAFLRSEDRELVRSFAALALDALALAGPAASLAGIRQTLAAPERRLAEFCARWVDGAPHLEAHFGPASGELARIARFWRSEAEAALRRLRELDQRLRAFADGDLARAVEAHQVCFANLVAAHEARPLLIELPMGKEKAAAPLAAALLAQLVAACAPFADRDSLGRQKRCELLVVIDAAALDALIADPNPHALAHANDVQRPPLFDAAMRAAAAHGVRFVVQAACTRQVATLLSVAKSQLVDNAGSAFAAVAAIGPQTEASAAFASALAGQRALWRRWRHQGGLLARWLFPLWESGDAWIVAPETLRRAEAGDLLLLLAGLKPIRCRSLDVDESASTFLAGGDIAAAAHDWNTPSSATAVAAPSTGVADDAAPQPRIAAFKLRRALSRTAVPALRPGSATEIRRSL